MKILGLWPGLFLLLVACASAQVTVEVTQNQQQFLPGEELKAAVRITNLSGQDLHLGSEEDWLSFAIESREGTVVSKLGEAPVLGAFVLGSSQVATKRVDLAPYFMLSLPGHYQIVATVRIRGWNREITSPPKGFDLIQGSRIWEQEVGIPRPAGATNAEPELRRYILQQANYQRGQLRLYLRVTDQYDKPIRVFAVGPTVSFGRPEPQVDRQSNLHLLYQDGASSFGYIVVNFQGELVKRQTYEYSTSRPHLRLDNEGNFFVMGGARRTSATDVPESKQDDPSDKRAAVAPDIPQQHQTNPSVLGKPDK